MSYAVFEILDTDGPRTTVGASTCFGTNGSSEVLFGLLFAGYGVGHFEDSDRVRKRWVELYAEARDAARAASPSHFVSEPTVSQMRAAIAATATEGDTLLGGFLRPYPPSIELGLKFKPAHCEVLSPIVRFWQGDQEAWKPPVSHNVVDAGDVPALASAVRLVAPFVTECPFHSNLLEVLDVLETAAAAGSKVGAG